MMLLVVVNIVCDIEAFSPSKVERGSSLITVAYGDDSDGSGIGAVLVDVTDAGTKGERHDRRS